MADQKLDALVYPTKTVPAPLLAAPVEPAALKTDNGVVTDVRAPLTPRLSPNSGLPVLAVPAGFRRAPPLRMTRRTATAIMIARSSYLPPTARLPGSATASSQPRLRFASLTPTVEKIRSM